MLRSSMVVLGIVASLTAAGGCQRKLPKIGAAVDQGIPVSTPVSRKVTEYVYFTGQANAVGNVNIIPRVTGFLVRMPFAEGTEVKQGALLFEIDARPYRAQWDAAEAKWAVSKAGLKLAQVTNVRFKELAKKEPSAVSQQDLDKYQALEEEAAANLKLSEANLELAKFYLDQTKVVSPIGGKISRYYLTLGNLVNQDQTLLTTVVSQDPMYAFFDMDEPNYMRIKRAINEDKFQLPGGSNKVPVDMGVQGEDGFPHQGKINFIDNQVFPKTGSISWRGEFTNPKPARGEERALAPGMFLRIRLPVGAWDPALLVIDRAVRSDQGLKNVYVLNAENKVEARRITTGPLQDDGLRVVEGLRPDDRVVVGALQQVRPGMLISPDLIPMPTNGPAEVAPPKSGKK